MSDNFLYWLEHQKEFYKKDNKFFDCDKEKGVIHFKDSDDVEIWKETFYKKMNLILETDEIKMSKKKIKVKNIFTYVRKNYMEKKLVSNIYCFEITTNKIDFLISITELHFNSLDNIHISVFCKDKKEETYKEDFTWIDSELLDFIKIFEEKAKEIYFHQKKVKFKSLFNLVSITNDSTFNRFLEKKEEQSS